MWCVDRAEVINLIGIDNTYKIYFKSSMSNSIDQNNSHKGRKFGGIGWIINKKNVGQHKIIFINERISVALISQYAMVGVYLTCNTNSVENRVEKAEEFQALSNLYFDLKSKYKVIFMGDFNCDLRRRYENDKLMRKWLISNRLKSDDIEKITDDDHTFFKANNKSWIDHVVTPIDQDIIKNVKIDKSLWNCGDHHALIGSIEETKNSMEDEEINDDKKSKNKIIWNDITKNIYNQKVQTLLNGIRTSFPEHFYNDRKLLESAVECLMNKLNKVLIEALDEISESNLKIKYKIKLNGWWDHGVEELYKEYRKAKINYSREQSTINKIIYKKAKNAFRKQQQNNIDLIRIKQFVKLNKRFKSNKKMFHGMVKKMKTEIIETTIDIEDAKIEIRKLFNECEIPNMALEEENKKKIDEFLKKNKDKCFNYVVDEENLRGILNKLPNGKAAGYNNITNEMIKYASNEKFIKILKLFYETIINHNVMPSNFNIGIVKLIIKDNKKEPDDVNNTRPLTISETWVNIFEKILLEEINKSIESSRNQFGFKSKSSCGHAGFYLKESILFNKRSHKKVFLCSIDASKAFDKVNRLILWGKLLDKIIACILRALIKYYSKLKLTIEINGVRTNFIRTNRGVKQGGPLSPCLFAIYVDDLSCLLNGTMIGIKIGIIIINNIFYADDILLLANDHNELNILLKITEKYGDDHEIKFNPIKTNFMVLFNGKNQESCTISFQGKTIERVSKIKYLGVWIDEKLRTIFLIQKRTRSTKLLRACKIDQVKDLIDNTKLNFAMRLLCLNQTKELINELERVDTKIKLDKKSLFYDLAQITSIGFLNFRQMVIEGIRMINEKKKENKDSMDTDEIAEVIEALKHCGNMRREKLNKILEIKFNRPNSQNNLI
ncbi:unnamed protein product [Brachionus calyciflorus]|uniref:Reverse transcriptase domain-containing protein n=1 Tax=Brachionus calyciflorus TaxID=104777 RepID=A0A814MUD4_9BILA|nr:unnamed protein product [Brachionus calyciflorus]